VSRPEPVVWAVVKERDGQRCVTCGRWTDLTFQHRNAVGMGGSKHKPLHAEGVTSCWLCNGEYERTLQTLALVYGWKVKKVKRAVDHPEDVPVFYVQERAWFVLTTEGTRSRISDADAAARMRDVYGSEWDEWVALAGLRRTPNSLATKVATETGWS
jgi:hypothetical protein